MNCYTKLQKIEMIVAEQMKKEIDTEVFSVFKDIMSRIHEDGRSTRHRQERPERHATFTCEICGVECVLLATAPNRIFKRDGKWLCFNHAHEEDERIGGPLSKNWGYRGGQWVKEEKGG